MTSRRTAPACRACGASGSRPLCVVRGHAYVRCTACGSGRLADPPADPTTLYTDDYFDLGASGGYRGYDADASLHRRTADRRLDRVAPWVPPGPVRLLDVGCASGYVLESARRRGWEAVGAEVSEAERKRAADRGLRTAPTIARALAGLSGPATAITFFQVLEHLADPAEALAEVARSALPGAVVCVETWDLGSRTARAFGPRWQQISPPSVLHLFTRPGLAAMCEGAGLRVVKTRVTPKSVSLGHVAGIAKDSWPRTGRVLDRTVDAVRLRRLPVPYVLDDLVTLTAVKPVS